MHYEQSSSYCIPLLYWTEAAFYGMRTSNAKDMEICINTYRSTASPWLSNDRNLPYTLISVCSYIVNWQTSSPINAESKRCADKIDQGNQGATPTAIYPPSDETAVWAWRQYQSINYVLVIQHFYFNWLICHTFSLVEHLLFFAHCFREHPPKWSKNEREARSVLLHMKANYELSVYDFV